MGSLFGLDGDKYVCTGSIILKRKQGLSDEQAAACPGTVVDLVPTKLESYGMKLLLKRINEATKKQVYFCADHDMEVIITCHQHLELVTNISNLSPISQTCHQHISSTTSVTNIDLAALFFDKHKFIK